MARRVMLAATASGSGKTTVTCAVLAALKAQGLDVVSFKCGPDYIDPMFHKKALGVESRNLDIFLMGEAGVRQSIAEQTLGRPGQPGQAAAGTPAAPAAPGTPAAPVEHNISLRLQTVAVIEGVMGLYDGLGMGSYASSNHLSLLTQTPVVLIVNAKGAARSLAATIQGFLGYAQNNIRGVILNNIGGALYQRLKEMIEEELPVRVIGYLEQLPEAQIESRHLGLVMADEIKDIEAKLALLQAHAEQTIDLAALLDIAAEAGDCLPVKGFFAQPLEADRPPKVYLAKDEAFSFFYEDNLELLRRLGAELAFFSPLHDARLPGDADGLVLWGGYPELFGRQLEGNKAMRASLKEAIQAGLPTYAECGGFIYLQEALSDLQGRAHKMLGVLPGQAVMANGLQNFGYYEIEALTDNMLCQAGEKARAHFFHHSKSTNEGASFMARKGSGQSFSTIVANENIFAGYQHLHFWGCSGFAKNFVRACIDYEKRMG